MQLSDWISGIAFLFSIYAVYKVHSKQVQRDDYEQAIVLLPTLDSFDFNFSAFWMSNFTEDSEECFYKAIRSINNAVKVPLLLWGAEFSETFENMMDQIGHVLASKKRGDFDRKKHRASLRDIDTNMGKLKNTCVEKIKQYRGR